MRKVSLSALIAMTLGVPAALWFTACDQARDSGSEFEGLRFSQLEDEQDQLVEVVLSRDGRISGLSRSYAPDEFREALASVIQLRTADRVVVRVRPEDGVVFAQLESLIREIRSAGLTRVSIHHELEPSPVKGLRYRDRWMRTHVITLSPKSRCRRS